MAVIVQRASHFEEVPKSLGATPDNMKSAESAIGLALDEREDVVDVKDIRVTQEDPLYRHWQRVRVFQSGVRVVFEAWREEKDIIILIHCVVPRASWTYDDIGKLGLKYRTSIAVPPQTPNP